MKRSDCHTTPVDLCLQARMSNSLSQFQNLSEEDRELIVEDIGRTIRGIMMDVFMQVQPVTFPEHNEIPDLCVACTLFDGDKLGR